MAFSKSPHARDLSGEILVILAVAFGSLIFVIANPASTSLSPHWIATFSTTFALIPFSILMFQKRLWPQLYRFQAVKYSAYAGLIISVFYYLLIHWGSYHTSPQNASIIACFEMLTASLLLHRKKNENLTSRGKIGSGLLLSAILLILLPNSSRPGSGDLILLLAGFVSPFGNWYMKKARSEISSITVLWVRSSVGALILLTSGFLFSSVPEAGTLSDSAIALTVNGIFVLGISKIFWLEGIHRIAIAKACSLTALGPVLTFLFAWLFLAQSPDLLQIAALPPTILGTYLIMSGERQKSEYP